MIITYPLPVTEPESHDYAVMVNGERIGAYQCLVSAMPFNTVWPGRQRPVEQTETASFISFDMDKDGGPVSLRVDIPRVFSEAEIRPLSKKIRPDREGGSLFFRIAEPGQYTLEIDGFHNALHIFVNSIENYEIDKNDPDVIYFGRGVHRPGLIELKSGQTLYADAGAVVHTAITANNQRNIRVIGHGILDNSEFHRTGDNGQRANSCMVLQRCENVEIRGVTFRDACAWTLTAWGCENVFIDNVKAIGMWRYNSDGFDMCNSRNIVISNCFVRAFDDCIVLKGFPHYNDKNVENIIVSGCVIWCDWGRGLEIGAETCAKEYRNILFEDCDIIHSAHMAMDIQNSGNAHVHDVTFDNIRVEYSKYCDEPIYQHSMDSEYKPHGNTHLPYLMFAEIHDYYHNMLVPGTEHGRNSDIEFRNIYVHLDEGLPTPPSAFSGLSEKNDTCGIKIRSLYINGEKIDSLERAAVRIGNFAHNITIE